MIERDPRCMRIVIHWSNRIDWWAYEIVETDSEAVERARALAIAEGSKNFEPEIVSVTLPAIGLELRIIGVPHADHDWHRRDEDD